MKLHKYCCFKLMSTKMQDKHIVDPRTVRYTEERLPEHCCVLIEDYPDIFHFEYVNKEDKGGTSVPEIAIDHEGFPMYQGVFRVGWDNLPTYHYYTETEEFERFDPHTHPEIMAWSRRAHQIKDEAFTRVLYDTELKHLRKAVKAIVQELPQLMKLPDVRKFLELSSFIESEIQKHPKSTDPSIVYSENGVSPERMKAFKAHGIDYGPTPKDIQAEVNHVDGTLFKKERAHINKMRFEQETVMQLVPPRKHKGQRIGKKGRTHEGSRPIERTGRDERSSGTPGGGKQGTKAGEGSPKGGGKPQ